jgi:DNA-binding phage protein
MPRSAPYDDLLMDMLKDEDRALAYLNAALDEPDRGFSWSRCAT